MKDLLYFYLDTGHERIEIRAYPKEDNEIACKCNSELCTHTLVAESTMKSMINLRRIHEPCIVVTSWFRCQTHNASESVNGKKDSKHLLGLAVDLWSPDLDLLERQAREEFETVIRYDRFIHCHNEE